MMRLPPGYSTFRDADEPVFNTARSL